MRIPAIAGLAVVLALAAACSSTTSKPAPAAPAAAAAVTSTAGAPAATTPAAPPPAAKLKVGATATLTTASGPLEVTLAKVVDPAKPAESYIKPVAGHHWIGLQLRLVNKGTAPFVDTPLLGIDAFDAAGQEQSSFPDQDVAAGALLDPVAGVRIAPGDTTLGYLVYDVPDGTKLARFQFAPPGASMAEWTLG